MERCNQNINGPLLYSGVQNQPDAGFWRVELIQKVSQDVPEIVLLADSWYDPLCLGRQVQPLKMRAQTNHFGATGVSAEGGVEARREFGCNRIEIWQIKALWINSRAPNFVNKYFWIHNF